MPAGGGPPALHRHAPLEVYRVEQGELALYVEDDEGEVQRIVARPGDAVLVPGGRAHTVRNESRAGARAYVVFSPGTEIECFMRAAGALAGDGRPDLAEAHGARGAPRDRDDDAAGSRGAAANADSAAAGRGSPPAS